MSDHLVSIIITTYNSSDFIIETLESVKAQTWKEIELIITDDCSSDSTVSKSNEWLKTNKARFVHAEILTTDKNTGVSANANRGLHCSKGDWIKLLGADDTLKSNCIEDNMLWISMHPEIRVLFSRVEVYKDNFELKNLVETIPKDPYNPNSLMAMSRSPESQYKLLLTSDRIHFTPSVFMNKALLLSIGGFDERFRLLEDYPLWLKFTSSGHKLYFMDRVTVNYRQHLKAINNTGADYLVNPNYFKSEDFRRIYTYPYLPSDIKLNQQFTWYVSRLFKYKWLNINKVPNRILLNILTIYLNPFKYYIWLKKFCVREIRTDEFYL